MPWTVMRLRGQSVLVRTDERGAPIADKNRVEIRYKPNDGRAYRALVSNLEPVEGAATYSDDHCGPGEAPARPEPVARGQGRPGGAPPKGSQTHAAEPAAGAVVVYADGACTGNPGPAGLGVFVDDPAQRRVLSEYLGHATNNIAELTAILRAAELFAEDPRPLEIRTDSQYSIGVLAKGWKAKANVELIAQVKAALARLGKRVRLTYVPGHSGVPGNERADELARDAVSARKTTGWRSI